MALNGKNSSQMSPPFKRLRETKIALILIASSNWVIEKNSSVKSLIEACFQMIDFSACDMRLIEENCIHLVSVTLEWTFPLNWSIFSADFKSILFICSYILFQFIKNRHKSQTGSFVPFFSLINSMRHRRKQRSSFSVFFFVSLP